MPDKTRRVHGRRFPQLIVGALGVVAWVVLAGPGDASQASPKPEPVQIPGNASALEGLPTVRIDATQEKATRRKLDNDEAARNSLKIRIVDGQYYWASREDSPLTVSPSGEFIYLLSTEPGKYVRLRQLKDRISYVEHVDVANGSVTYWGELRIVVGK